MLRWLEVVAEDRMRGAPSAAPGKTVVDPKRARRRPD